MIQVFMLVLIMGIGEDRKPIDETLYFRSIEVCNATAKELAKRWGHWSILDQVSVYCLPTSIDKNTPLIDTPID
tara:strand:+ start:473 stop:694 length:222 start_codon:yes stop_codon:yes gene_type:complete